MSTYIQRIIAFLFLCIPMRILFVLVAKYIDKKYLPFLGYIGIIIGIGFMYNFIIQKNKGSTFGQNAWWHFLRPFHSILYFTFAYFALNKNNNAYIPLLIDVVIGLLFFCVHHK